jgi:hypothetical protein
MIEQSCRSEELEVERIGLLLVQSDLKAVLAWTAASAGMAWHVRFASTGCAGKFRFLRLQPVGDMPCQRKLLVWAEAVQADVR